MIVQYGKFIKNNKNYKKGVMKKKKHNFIWKNTIRLRLVIVLRYRKCRKLLDTYWIAR